MANSWWEPIGISVTSVISRGWAGGKSDSGVDGALRTRPTLIHHDEIQNGRRRCRLVVGEVLILRPENQESRNKNIGRGQGLRQGLQSSESARAACLMTFLGSIGRTLNPPHLKVTLLPKLLNAKIQSLQRHIALTGEFMLRGT
jgi:hypothetical protein